MEIFLDGYLPTSLFPLEAIVSCGVVTRLLHGLLVSQVRGLDTDTPNELVDPGTEGRITKFQHRVCQVARLARSSLQPSARPASPIVLPTRAASAVACQLGGDSVRACARHQGKDICFFAVSASVHRYQSNKASAKFCIPHHHPP